MSRLRDWFGRHLFPGSGPKPRPEPAPEWVHPYPRKSPRLSGEAYRARYLDYTLDEAGHARAAGIGGGDL
ncbi:hypothetical protein [Pseudactinotalea sp. Z1748]|uniref:hypothetical protein n=1 Tax=Pseudactinotalea sp. Z1748 TaxID=3413027 RepID=UPI003C7D9A98